MIIVKKALPRRTFLRGAGAVIALPFLDAMVPALSAFGRTSAAASAKRLGIFYVANGMFLPNFHPAGDGGTNFELTPILQPLSKFKNDMVVVTGLSNLEAEFDGAGRHSRGHTAYLSGFRAIRTEGGDLRGATTVDQYVAGRLGADTQLMSLELAVESSAVGSCESGYGCTYSNTFSWRTPTMPLPMEENPRAVFERLFGEVGSSSNRLAEMRTDASILDAVAEDVAKLQRRVGAQDRRMVDDFTQAVREVERRIQQAEKQRDRSPEVDGNMLLGIPDSFDEHAKLMFDLLFLAYQADITRVSTLQLSREQSGRAYPWIGVGEAHHGVSHHSSNPQKIASKTKIDVYHMELFSRFVAKMKAAPDGDGSLLDHSILMYGAGLSDGDQHSMQNLPVVLVGGGDGQLKGGRHMKYPLNTPMMNLGMTLLDKFGVEGVERIGDSTGRLPSL